MIRIVSVQGDVLIDDNARKYTQMAKPGMTFMGRADLLIVTNSTSRATINVGGTDFKLGPLGYLRVHPNGRSWWARHGLGHRGDARRWIGMIWAMLGGPTNPDPKEGNAVVGVRG